MKQNLNLKFTVYILFSFFSFCLLSCGSNDKKKLTQAIQVLEARPDSAYVLLKEIDYSSLTDDKDKADYILAHARANTYMGRSLIADTMIHKSAIFYKNVGDTASFLDASVAQARHLRSIGKNVEAYRLIEALAEEMPKEIRRNLNQELLSFSFADKEPQKSLEIIDRQIDLAHNNTERIDFEIKKNRPINIFRAQYRCGSPL